MQRIIVDYKKCSGCRLCEYACSNKKINTSGVNPKISAIRTITLGLYKADIPVLCKQCAKPLCKENCPTNAFYYDDNTGIWNIDENSCIGCGICAEKCPFGAITLHQDILIPLKCNLCAGDPACVSNCITGALTYSSNTQIGENQRLKYAETLTRSEGGK